MYSPKEVIGPGEDVQKLEPCVLYANSTVLQKEKKKPVYNTEEDVSQTIEIWVLKGYLHFHVHFRMIHIMKTT